MTTPTKEQTHEQRHAAAAIDAAVAADAADPDSNAGKLDETTPGGRYLVNGVFVDANGEPIKDQRAKKDK